MEQSSSPVDHNLCTTSRMKKEKCFLVAKSFYLKVLVFQKKQKFRGFRLYSHFPKSSICRYQETFSTAPSSYQESKHLSNKEVDNWDWQLLIKIDDHRHRKTKRVRYAFEAINKEGSKIFLGCNSNGKSSPALAVLETLVGALLQAKELGFLHIVVLTGKQKSRENMR